MSHLVRQAHGWDRGRPVRRLPQLPGSGCTTTLLPAVSSMSQSIPPRRQRHDVVRVAAAAVPARPDRRQAALKERDRLLAELDDVDDELAALANRRAGLVARLAELREELWPVALWRRGRRPSICGENSLPPLPADVTWLEGRRLRSVCLALLRRAARRLSLSHLHALLHAHGYGIDSSYPAKTLADALGYEVECGRARRVRRGEYEVAGPPPRSGRHGAPPLRDRLLDEILVPVAA